jgi:carboxypeptidase C (cathepsin A)
MNPLFLLIRSGFRAWAPILPLTAFAICSLHAAEPAPKSTAGSETADAATSKARAVEPVTRQGSVSIDGRNVAYEVKAGKMTLLKEDGAPSASVFHVSYVRTDVKDRSSRPVMFAFNGGPGSSAVWLHLGVLGPKIVSLSGDGTSAPLPPARVIDNASSILDVCDIVFIDPVSTGYSRIESGSKPEEFHGLHEDIAACGDIVRRWVTENNRWASPKFLLGESYGGIRVAGLSKHLQSRHGMMLNGVVLLSSLLNFATLEDAQGHDLTHLVYLPTFTTVALHHGKIRGDRDALLKRSRDFALGPYAAALLRGNELDAATRSSVAAELAELTGIAADTWLRHDLRITPWFFRSELLRDQGKVIGRFDARVAWDATDRNAQVAEYDPSYSLAYGAFATALLDYLGRDLGYKEDQPYEILTGKVHPWKWGADNDIVNVSSHLMAAMRDNPRLQVLVMAGHNDLATPPEGMAHSIRHMTGLSDALKSNIRTVEYDAGHMFYLNPPDLLKSRKDLVEFIGTAIK